MVTARTTYVKVPLPFLKCSPKGERALDLSRSNLLENEPMNWHGLDIFPLCSVYLTIAYPWLPSGMQVGGLNKDFGGSVDPGSRWLKHLVNVTDGTQARRIIGTPV